MTTFALPGIAGIALGQYLLAHAVPPKTTAAAGRQPDTEPHLYYSAGAAYIARGIETEALRTDDVAATLDACRTHLPDVLPQAAARCNIGPDLAAELMPYLEHWLFCAANVHRLRATAEGPFREVLDIMLDAIRKGADPVRVGERALELLQQVRAEGRA